MTVTLHPRAGDWPTSEEVKPWQQVPVAMVVDIDHSTRINTAIRPLGEAGKNRHLCGPAFTVSCHPPDFGAVVHALDAAMPGDVLVIAANGDRDTAMIGDILSGHLRAKGLAGIVCDGAVRDTNTLASWDDFPVFTRHVCPNGPASAGQGEVLAPVSFGGRTVYPGELVLGDDDGLAVLGRDMMLNGLDGVAVRHDLEKRWADELASGKSAIEVFGVDAPVKPEAS